MSAPHTPEPMTVEQARDALTSAVAKLCIQGIINQPVTVAAYDEIVSPAVDALILAVESRACEGLPDPSVVPELLAALKLIESVYRQNVVVEGEPSSVLQAVQAALAKAGR